MVYFSLFVLYIHLSIEENGVGHFDDTIPLYMLTKGILS